MKQPLLTAVIGLWLAGMVHAGLLLLASSRWKREEISWAEWWFAGTRIYRNLDRYMRPERRRQFLAWSYAGVAWFLVAVALLLVAVFIDG